MGPGCDINHVLSAKFCHTSQLCHSVEETGTKTVYTIISHPGNIDVLVFFLTAAGSMTSHIAVHCGAAWFLVDT